MKYLIIFLLLSNCTREFNPQITFIKELGKFVYKENQKND